ncbi:hypothetical protein [Holospora elegans]|uniref:hypothetical protein n=1 Tax=Holospora elegans TaxID=431043 RepID=UPI003570E645
MNIRIALKAVLFEEVSGTNVKNPCFIRKRLFNEPNCSAFWCRRHRRFEAGGHLIIKAMRQNRAISRRQRYCHESR